MLTPTEKAKFDLYLKTALAGIYRARDILGPIWLNIADKNDYGRRLRGSVEAGHFSRVTRISRSLQNHQLYRVKT